MLEVSSGKTDPGFFRGSSNSEVSHPNPRMAATPAATKSPFTSRHDLGQGNPDDQSKQPIRRADRLFGLIVWVPLTEVVARRAGGLGRRWRRSHPGIGVADLTIAATAEEAGVGLATRNLKHFPMFADLRDPY